jgi:hypothetical protein
MLRVIRVFELLGLLHFMGQCKRLGSRPVMMRYSACRMIASVSLRYKPIAVVCLVALLG